MSQKPERGAGVDGVDMSDETVVVTGSTSGIGRETALALARLGAHVVVHGRDEAAGESVVVEANETDGSAAFVGTDFSTTDAVRDFAENIRAETDSVDVLVNNAGGLFSEGRLTGEGVEYTFAVNHLGPYVLTAELLPLLRDSAGRVVVTSSGAHTRTEMNFEAVTEVEDYSSFRAYCMSKLANVMFTRELSRRLEAADTSVVANCFHPGAVPGTGFPRQTPLPIRIAARAVAALPDAIEGRLATTVPEAAETAVYLAAARDADGISGEYLYRCRPREPSEEAKDDDKARRLWELSRELTGVGYDLPET